MVSYPLSPDCFDCGTRGRGRGGYELTSGEDGCDSERRVDRREGLKGEGIAVIGCCVHRTDMVD